MNTSLAQPTAAHDIHSSNGLGLQERMILMEMQGPQARLSYETELLKMSNGETVEKYLIPEDEKPAVLEALYPFMGLPAMDASFVDLHTGRQFAVRDFIVVREGDGNFLVTPYYAEAGGTVLDWVPVSYGDDSAGRVFGQILKQKTASVVTL